MNDEANRLELARLELEQQLEIARDISIDSERKRFMIDGMFKARLRIEIRENLKWGKPMIQDKRGEGDTIEKMVIRRLRHSSEFNEWNDDELKAEIRAVRSEKNS